MKELEHRAAKLIGVLGCEPMAVVGIDLGTTNTVVGVVSGGQATTLQDAEGYSLIPSVVSLHPNGTVLVGRAARERRLMDAKNTVYSIKRLIGRSWNSEEVARARSRFPFEMREGPGQAALVVVRGESFTLPEISAFVLRHAKALAEKQLGETVDRAVITVPANFNDLQRAATKVAGRVAGLEVLRILNEPTAAALAYGYGRASNERIVIYDFGGGTFDVTLLDLSGNVFEVLATAGNTFLGGDDLDTLVADRMAEACLREYRLDPRTDPQALELLRLAAERLKVGLSANTTHTEVVSELIHGASGHPVSFSYTMTRAELEALIAPLVDKTFEVCREALAVARIPANQFNQVVLVGGSTRIPIVRERVARFFEQQVLDHVSPDEVVAIGAAIQANALTGAERRRSTLPRPPMPAARTVSSSLGPSPLNARRSTAPPLPQRKTHPFGRSTPPKPPGRSPIHTLIGVAPDADDPTAQRQVTGVGLGSPPLSARRNPPTSEPPSDLSRPELARSRHAGMTSPPGLDGAASAPMPLHGPPATQPTRRAAALAPPMAARPIADTDADGIAFDEAMFPPPAGVDDNRPQLLGLAPPQVRSIDISRSDPARGQPPLLVDVTPLSLSVETVGGYRDVIIQRNCPVPCEQARTFVTARDNQPAVNVRVGQGESEAFRENTLLGQLELTGLPRAPRGEVRITVTFGLDADGILNVSAREESTGRQTQARLRLVGLPEERDVMQMASRQATRRVVE